MKRLDILTKRLDIAFETKPLPKYPGYLALFGPGIILTAMGLGSGELIWWPYAVGKYGAFFLGWYIIFFLLPYAVQVLIGRYTVMTGESIYEGFHRIHHLLGWFMFIAILIIGGWVGGYVSAGATALSSLTNFPAGWDARSQTLFWSIVAIWITFFLVLLGPVAYKVIEIVGAISAFISLFGMLAVVLAVPDVYKVAGDFFRGLLTLQSSLVPPNWDPKDADVLNTLLAYSGATGGFWGLMYSFWVRDKGLGMSKHCGRVTSPFTGELEAVPSTGFGFEPTEENLREYKKWSRVLWIDVGFSIFLQALTTLLVVILSYALLFPKGIYPTGWRLVVVQADFLGALFGEIGRKAFYFIGFFWMIDTYLVAIDHFSRMVASNLQSNIPATRRVQYRTIYYLTFIIYSIIGSITIFFATPGALILATGVANQLIMIIYTFAFLYLNWYLLPKIHQAGKNIRPSIFAAILMVVAALVWIYAFTFMIPVWFGKV
jgi:hypothetical protein